MAKNDLEKILIPGAVLEVRIIDPNDPEIKEMLEDLKREQEKIMDQKKVDWGLAERTYITI